MSLVDVGLILVGLLLIIKASELAINSLLRIASEFGITEFTAGFLVIGIASVLPELSLGLASSLEGASSLGLGVIFGSNVADLTLILGIVAVYAGGVKLESKTLQSNLYFLFVTALPVLLAFDGEISRLDGVVLLLAFGYYVYRIVEERKSFSKTLDDLRKHKSDFFDQVVIAAFAVGVMFLAAYMVSNAAINISAALQLPLVVLGAVIAFGTCLPELSFSLQSLRENHPELGLGDIMGNVIVDCTATLGVIALVNPIRVAGGEALAIGLVMVAATLLSVLFMKTGARLSRREGVVLILAYVVFLAFQFIGR